MLLLGDNTAIYSHGDRTTVGREESYGFIAKESGVVEELQLRTNEVASTGVTSVVLGILADNGSNKPGAVLGQATAAGEPATSSWVKATGLSIHIEAGIKYWLTHLPLGAAGKQLHFNVANAGGANVESFASALTEITEETEWKSFNEGPIGFQALGTPTSLTIAGARIIEKTQPWITPSLELYDNALGQVFQAVLEIAEEEGTQGEVGWIPAWGKLMDPILCPAKYLPYLAQFTGTEIPKTATEEEARRILIQECNLFRGTLKHLEFVIKAILGTTPFTIEERTNPLGEEKGYYFLVLVPPGHASAQLKVAIEEAKPGGVLFEVIEIEGAWISGGLSWEEIGAGVTFESIKEGEF